MLVLDGDDPLPQGLGIRSADEHSAFHWLYWGRCPIVRTRDAERLVRALEHHLSLAPRAPTPELQLELTAGVLASGEAFLLPKSRSEMARLERRLQSAGGAFSDTPYATVDPVQGDLVVHDPSVTLPAGPGRRLLDHLGTTRKDPYVRPGRYPIGRWLVDDPSAGSSASDDLPRLLDLLSSPTTEGGLVAGQPFVRRLRIVAVDMQDVSAVLAKLTTDGSGEANMQNDGASSIAG